MADQKALYEIGLKDSFSKGLSKIDRRVDGFEKSVKNSSSAASNSLGMLGKSLIGLSAVYAGGRFISETTKLFDIQEKAVAKVGQAIKSTGMAAGFTLDQLTAEASALQEKTLFGDEDILNNATAQLLTFTNIAGDNFKRTQTVALDLATVLDQDLKSASIQLGKALNDPVANLSALSRSGIQFSTSQKDVIKQLATTGRLAEAQGVILQELERQYGGQAKAAAEVGLGPYKQLSNSLGDVQEKVGGLFIEIGVKLLPVFRGTVKLLDSVVTAIQRVDFSYITMAFDGLWSGITEIKNVFSELFGQLNLNASGFFTLQNIVKGFSVVLRVITTPLRMLMTGLLLLKDLAADIGKSFSGLGLIIKGVLTFNKTDIAQGMNAFSQAAQSGFKDLRTRIMQFAKGESDYVKNLLFPDQEQGLAGASQVNSLARPTAASGANAAAAAQASKASSTSSSIAGSSPKNVTLNITKLIETINFNNHQLKQSSTEMTEAVKRALLTALNDVSIVQS